MEDSSFHVTLPSNSRSNYKNTASSFRITLPRRLELSGQWEVGVSEVFIPITHYNLGNSDEKGRQILFQLHWAGKINLIGVTISAGNYPTIEKLIAEINRELANILKEPYSCKFFVDEVTRHTLIETSKTAEFLLIYLGRELAYILGFPLTTADIHFSNYKAVSQHPCDISANLNEVYIYSDLIRTQFVGNSEVKLLRIVSIRGGGSFGEVVHRIFERPQFHALASNSILEVQVELRTAAGAPFPIRLGNTIIQLTFRRRGLRL